VVIHVIKKRASSPRGELTQNAVESIHKLIGYPLNPQVSSILPFYVSGKLFLYCNKENAFKKTLTLIF
jgi:hypothetical protein